jgi:hypothetical protein
LNRWRWERDHRAGGWTVDLPSSVLPAEREIMGFQKVNQAEFEGIIAGNGSEAFQRLAGRYDSALTSYAPDDCVVHRGPLSLPKLLRAPAYATIVLGDLTVDGLIALDNPEGYDEPAEQVIEPRNDRDASLRRLAFDDTDYIEPHEFLERLRNGQSVFR